MAEYIVRQTDERTYLLAQKLKAYTPSKNTWVFAPNIVVGANELADVKEGEIVIGGRADKEGEALMNAMDIRHFNMLSDDRFQAVNARLTAEGVLGIILSHSLSSLTETDFLVIGFGRCGSAITKILKDVGGKSVTVASTYSKRQASGIADEVVAAENFDFSPYGVVVNTVPQSIISDKETLTFREGAIYIDVASKPALSLCFAKYIGVDADIYPALPAKCAPESAANAMLRYVLEVTK